MSSKKLVWDAPGEHFYETGISNVALYVQENGKYPKGVAWNGVTSITESPSGAEPSPLYADNTKYLNLISNEDFGATIEAYTYPDEFKECDGTKDYIPGVSLGQQARKAFGLAYKTIVGNDDKLNDYGYKLHLIYGATASVSEKAYSSVNDSPEANTFSWELTTVPVNVAKAGFKPTSIIVIDSTKFKDADAAKLKAIEDALFGTETTEPYLPLPDSANSSDTDTIAYIMEHAISG